MVIDNVLVYTENKEFVKGGIVLENDTIKSVYKDGEKPQVDNDKVIDGNGAFAIPGLIDLHFHGCKKQLNTLQNMSVQSVLHQLHQLL